MHSGRADGAEEGGGSLTAIFDARKEPVLAAERDAAQRALAAVVVDLQGAVLDESAQSCFPFDRVHHCLADRTLRKDTATTCRAFNINATAWWRVEREAEASQRRDLAGRDGRCRMLDDTTPHRCAME